MVYCGKPSRGCGNCRKRRIRCDTKLPSCTQCTKAQRDCPGYREPLEVMFRDQTALVIDKHQKEVVRRVNPDPEIHVPSLFSLKESISDIAVNLLLTKYSVGSHFEFLSQQCRTSIFQEPFRSSLQCVALARFANDVRNQDLAKIAMTKYNNAVNRTSKALQDPELAKSDDTLASILLLASFESTLTEIRTSTETWTKHVYGAYTLLMLRGKAVLQTPVGRSIFLQIVGSITLDSVQHRRPIPIQVQKMVADMDATSPRSRFRFIVGDFVALRASTVKGHHIHSAELAESLELRLEELALDMRTHEIYEYQVVRHDNDDIPGGYSHIYTCPVAALLWNAVRMLRVAIQEHIYEMMLQSSESSNDMATNSERLLAERRKQNMRQIIPSMCHEVCASVSQFTTITTNTTAAFSPMDDVHHRKNSDNKWDRVTAIHFLLWPLFRIGSSNFAPPPVREYAIKQLLSFNDKFDVKRALIAANAIEDIGTCRDDWMHVAHMY